jgi:hypothetical protein
MKNLPTWMFQTAGAVILVGWITANLLLSSNGFRDSGFTILALFPYFLPWKSPRCRWWWILTLIPLFLLACGILRKIAQLYPLFFSEGYPQPAFPIQLIFAVEHLILLSGLVLISHGIQNALGHLGKKKS